MNFVNFMQVQFVQRKLVDTSNHLHNEEVHLTQKKEYYIQMLTKGIIFLFK